MSDVSTTELAHLRFCLRLHREVAGSSGNSCFSPYSVASALGLAAQATRGATAAELTQLLAGSGSDVHAQAELLRAAAELAKRHERAEAPQLAVANTLWAWDQLRLYDTFRDELSRWPNGSVKPAPFVTQPEQARQAINADVADTTRDLIPELLPSGTIDDSTVAAIVNALYLRVAWLDPFFVGDTATMPFTTPTATRMVPTMHHTARFGYARQQGWELIEIPAAGDVQGLIFLPEQDLTTAETTMDERLVTELLAAKQSTRLRLSMSKLDLNYRANLPEALQNLGVQTIFSPQADFGGLTDDPRIQVSEVLHQAVLRLDERGLEGAAATAAIAWMSFDPEPTIVVKVDRPFLLLVRHAATGAIYFMARVEDPSKS